ncbi:serine/threonine-protein kinase [Labedaea rhizosphaerae]|uniref:non-specific serine/threonine protein kinase n=1 Tax=Labedaea rhizosphaerae TaxID=598644 RepID=A0A4R6RZX7_LABRH|nr:serine/threonine-protein kinase [Labedaea rhizosphaerae]TDP91875.1 serine/threonine-protein kinase [Labedaea rhizosphaerae]
MTVTGGLATALPQYAIGGKIGHGGMGEVYEGVHRSLGRQVAIKLLPAGLAGDEGADARFDREARVLASLDHPHIVPVYDYLHTEHGNLLVMEKLDGGTVHSRFRAEGLTAEQTCAIGLAMLGGLHAAHRAGVLHLDVKPKNLLFATSGVMKVADFGIAQVVSEGATLVTHAGEVLGTPAYIAPEQAMGNALTPAADIYAAGTVLYELLCGELPYDRSSGGVALMRQHIFADPRPIPGVPRPLAEVVMRSIARDPAGRYRDAEHFAVDLARAASMVFGAGWLDRARVPVHLAPQVVAAAASGGDATAPTRPVRAHGPDPTVQATAMDLRDRTLIPARELITGRRRGPLAPALGAFAALIALVVLVVTTPKTVVHQGFGGLAVTGADALDLTRDVTVSGDVGAAKPSEVSLTLSAAGVDLASASTSAVSVRGKRFVAAVRLPAVTRWVAGGAVTGEVTVRRPDQVVVTSRLTVLPAQQPLASVMGAGSLLIALFTIAYLESLLRGLRRGLRRRSTPYAAVPLGLVFGAAVWLFVGTLTRHEPVVGYAFGAAALGALAAVGAVLATRFAADRGR